MSVAVVAVADITNLSKIFTLASVHERIMGGAHKILSLVGRLLGCNLISAVRQLELEDGRPTDWTTKKQSALACLGYLGRPGVVDMFTTKRGNQMLCPAARAPGRIGLQPLENPMASLNGRHGAAPRERVPFLCIK